MHEELTKKLKRIKLFVTDFDGIHTDGCVYVGEDGKESVKCSRRDGLGIAMLKKAGIDVRVISKETNPVVSARCRKLQIPCEQGVADSNGKADILKRIVEAQKLASDEVLYMGDDLNDTAPLEFAGVAVTVADGHQKLISVCDYVTTRKGGEHAIREVAEMVLHAQGYPLTF